MAITKSKLTPKSTPQLFSITFYIALLGFLFGAFALGISLIVLKPLQNNKSLQSVQINTAQLRYCYDNDLKPRTTSAISRHIEAHPQQ